MSTLSLWLLPPVLWLVRNCSSQFNRTLALGLGIMLCLSAGQAHAQPSAPTGLTVTPHSDEAALSWNAVTGATGYKVYRDITSSSPSPTLIATLGAVTTYTDSTADNNTTYYYVVTAVDSATLESVPSTEVDATPTPWATIRLDGQEGDGEVALNWTPAGAATSYKVYKDSGSGPVLAGTVTPTTDADNHLTITGLTNSTSYGFSVIGWAGGVIVSQTMTPLNLIPGFNNLGGYYDGASDVTWIWSESLNVNEQTGSGTYNTTLPIAGPEAIIVSSLDKVSAVGTGRMAYLRNGHCRKTINWSWVTGNSTLYPAPWVTPKEFYIWSIFGSATASSNSSATLRYGLNKGANSDFLAGGTIFSGYPSGGTVTDSSSGTPKIALSHTRGDSTVGHFQTDQRIDLTLYPDVLAENASESASGEYFISAYIRTLLEDAEEYTGP
ncbi:hypothetical protein IAD21_02417 [Abditibacteriota bacterium]|nr:hypothetical protein IAD21_02417 [Abditibacteriota bacterium]